MLATPSSIFNAILSIIRGKKFKQKLEQDEIIEKAHRQIENDLDIVELVKVQ